MYYKNKENKPYFEPSQEIISRDSLEEITKEEFDSIVYEINNPSLTEYQRVALIKAKAEELITSKYPIYKQLNILMSGVTVDIDVMNDYITAIRIISNEAEINKTQLEDISWK